MAPADESKAPGEKKKMKRKIEEIRNHLIKNDEDASSEENAPIRKAKKPKHLNRKIAQAQHQGDSSILQTLIKQKEDLAETKNQRAADWETLCKKLVRQDKWNQEKFDKLMKIGLNKKKMLEALGVERERDKKKKDFRATTTKPKLNRKALSRNKKKQKKMAASGTKVTQEAPSSKKSN